MNTIVLLALMLLAACGGGGDEEEDTRPWCDRSAENRRECDK